MEFLALLFMTIKMNILLHVIIWGINSLCIGWDMELYVASELKHLEGYCTKIQLFPGHYLTSKMVNLYNGTKETDRV
jgi:hypothetical protein